MNKQIALENLKEAVDILNKNNLYWWIDAGTCLGAIRDKDFIDHDTDTDVAMLYPDDEVRDQLIADMVASGFELIHIFGKKNCGLEYAFKKNGEKIDFFFYDIEKGKGLLNRKDGITMSIWKRGERIILDFPLYLFNELKQIDFLGLKVNVPNPPEEYLNVRYGDWQKAVEGS